MQVGPTTIGIRISLLLALLGGVAAEAIIVRHDVNDESYLVDTDEFPAVFYLEEQGARRVCVATLVHPRWAVSAAHCADETLLGATIAERRRFAVQIGGQTREIDALIRHPDFDLSADDDVDLMLLRFRRPIEDLSPYPLQLSSDEEGQTARLLGWGYTGRGLVGRELDDGRLRMARNVIDSASRRLRISFDDPRLAADLPIRLEGMPSLGDSGGPLLIESDQGLVLAGIAIGEVKGPDFSEDTQGRYGAVAVYERLFLHQRWIETVIGAELPFES